MKPIQFGVVKPADKTEKQEKKKDKKEHGRKPDEGHRPFKIEMQKIQDEQQKVREEIKLAQQQKKEEEKKKSQEAAQAAKFGEVWKYAEEKKAQHNLPEAIYQKLRGCECKGAAKNIVKNFLQEQAKQQAIQSIS
jgi:hypothetical protein